MKTSVKIIGLVVTFALLFTFATGCQKDTGKTEGTNASTAGQQGTVEQPKDISLRFAWWGGDARHKATLDAIALYTQLHPNIKIEAEYGGYEGYFQKLTTQLAGATAPDLIQIDPPWLYDFSKQGKFFVDLYETNNIIDTGLFDKKFLEDQCSWDGRLEGLPTGIIAEELFIFNSDFFAQNGIDANIQWNWDNLLEIGEKVHAANENNYLLHAVTDHTRALITTYMIQRTGQSLVKDDYTVSFDEKLATEAFAYLKAMLDKGVLRPFEESIASGAIDENTKWQKGESGMMMDASSVITKITGNSKFNLGVSPLPILEGTVNTGIQMRPAQLLSINAASKSVEECEKFLAWFFTDKEAIMTLKDARGVPSTISAQKVLAESKVISPLVVEATEENSKVAGLPINAVSFDSELVKILNDFVEQIAFKKLTPEQAGQQLVAQYNDKLQELKSLSK